MEFTLSMIVKADVTIRPDFKAYGGKTPDQWTEEEITNFKNELASDFHSFELGRVNGEKRTMINNFRVESFK